MKKIDLIEYLGGTAEKAAKRLDYAHRNSIQRFGDYLTPRQVADITRRMKAKRINIPKEWFA